MFDWLFVSPAERRLLGGPRFGGPTPWVIAIMSFSIMLIAASGLALASTAALYPPTEVPVKITGSGCAESLASTPSTPSSNAPSAPPPDKTTAWVAAVLAASTTENSRPSGSR